MASASLLEHESHGPLSLRRASPTDLPFLERLYASTRADELALVDWSERQKSEFVRMQFLAQHRYYHAEFADARFDIVELDGQAVGRLYVERRVDEIRIIDIALLPGWRNRGLGSSLMLVVFAEAAAVGLPVRIHVEQANRALRLYERLGFRRVGISGIHLLLEHAAVARTERAG